MRYGFLYTQDHTGYAAQIGPRDIRAGSLDELATLRQAVVDEATALAGRDLTDRELLSGPSKPDSRPYRDQMAAEIRHKAELNPPPATKSPTEQRLDLARERAEAERRETLTTAQRELEDATREAEAEAQQLADRAKRAEIRDSTAYRALRARIDDLLFAAMYDPTIDAATLQEVRHQSELLERFLDVTTVKENVTQIQQSIADQIQVEADRLKQASDQIAKRRQLASSGLAFDGVDTIHVGDNVYVSLTVGDRTVRITEDRFKGRESDEALRDELFEVTND